MLHPKIVNISLQENELDHIKLAKIAGFNDQEIEMVQLFWDVTFNKSWLLITSELVHNQLGYKKTESSLRDLYKKMKEFYKNEIEYKEVTKDHELVEFYYKNLPGNISRQDKHGGSNKKYYIITGETFKKMCMRANTVKGNETCDYFIKVESLCNIMSKYLIEKFKIEQQKQLEEKQKLLEEKEKALQISESKNLKLTTFIKENEKVKEDGWIYIATTRQYSQNNIYKLGKTEKLNPRMGNYQTGRSKSDSYYYVYTYKTSKRSVLETLLKKLLEKYKEDKNKELFVLPWKLLHEYVDYICSNFNDCFIFELNQLIQGNLDYANRNETPEIPDPLDLSKAIVEQDEALDDNNDDNDDNDDIENDDDGESENVPVEEEETVDSGIGSEEIMNIEKSIIPKSTRLIKCRPCGFHYYQDGFDVAPNGNYTSTCKNCTKDRLNNMINEILDKFNTIKKTKSFIQSKNVKNNRIRMNEITHELHQLKNIDIYKKKTITETQKFKRCGHEHVNEFERWLPKSKFSVSAGKLKSSCKDCFNTSERKRTSK